MAITVGSNIASLHAQRRLAETTDRLQRSTERLSSGLRISRPSDDPAGLSVSTSLNTDKRVFAQGIRNLNDGVSALSITEGALQELSGIATRQLELAEQAANGTFSSRQRESLETEANALVDEWNRIVQTTSFNGIRLLDGSSGGIRMQDGYGTTGSIYFNLGAEFTRSVGNGTFAAGTSYLLTGSGTSVIDTSVGDFNRDGKLDIAASPTGAAGIQIFLGVGDGTFTTGMTITTAAGQTSTVGDVNGDGYLDFIHGHYTTNDSIDVALGNGDGTFKAVVSYQTTTNWRPSNAVLADVNGDNKIDLLASSGSTTLTPLGVMLGNGDGTFNAFTSYGVTTWGGGFELEAADFNGDNKIDTVVLNFQGGTGQSATLFLGNGDGTFKASTTITLGVSVGPRSSIVADIDNDGDQDLAIGETGTTSIMILLNNGDGTFTIANSFSSSGPSGLKHADINGDGFIDLLATETSPNRIGVYFGNGDGTFKARMSSASMGTITGSHSIGDFNSDGAIDVATSGGADSTIKVFMGGAVDVGTIGYLSFATQEYARNALTTISEALGRVSLELGAIGSTQSRYTSAINRLGGLTTHLAQAESRISDVDVAEETGDYIQTQILQQSSTAILAQANQLPALVLKLLT